MKLMVDGIPVRFEEAIMALEEKKIVEIQSSKGVGQIAFEDIYNCYVYRFNILEQFRDSAEVSLKKALRLDDAYFLRIKSRVKKHLDKHGLFEGCEGSFKIAIDKISKVRYEISTNRGDIELIKGFDKAYGLFFRLIKSYMKEIINEAAVELPEGV